jgi:spermidine synthase
MIDFSTPATSSMSPRRAASIGDPCVRDTWVANKAALVAMLFLVVAASLGLCAWPGATTFPDLLLGTSEQRFNVLNSVAFLFAILFWGAWPSRAEMRWALAGGVVVWALLSFLLPPMFQPSKPGHVLLAFSIPCVVLVIHRAAVAARAGREDVIGLRMRAALVLLLLNITLANSALQLSAVAHPQVMDFYALAMDQALNFGLAAWIVQAVRGIPWLLELHQLLYGYTPAFLLCVVAMQLRGKRAHVPSVTLVWFLMTVCACTAYHLFPITGPRYVFGDAGLATALAKPVVIQPALMLETYPRNGMPSMHFGWAFAACIVFWQTVRHWLPRAISALATLGVASATIALGEHYLIDLVVAIPFVLGAMAMVTTAVPWTSVAKQRVVIAGFGQWLVWVLSMRFAMPFMQEHQWVAFGLLFATVAVVILQIFWRRQFVTQAVTTIAPTPAPEAVADLDAQRRWLHRFGLMFVTSGAAALVYQVVFAKKLALVFGSTATATFTVLATFLGGMSIGALIGGAMATRSRRPLRDYAIVELAIAVYCVASPFLFDLAQSAYVSFAGGMPPDAPQLLVLRIALGAAVLVVPTALMGMTLPLLAQALGDTAGSLGQRVAWLYFCNTIGAALGALLTAYFVIPALGIQRTVLVAALLNLMVALGALELLKQPDADRAPAPMAPGALGQTPFGRLQVMLAMAALGIGGMLSLGLEVAYVHLLSIVAGNSVYAFGLMLAAFLVGLSLGGEGARRLLGRLPPAAGLAGALLCLAVSITLTASGWNAIPEYFAGFAQYGAARSFGSREAIRGMVCALIMVPPTLCIGAAYVFAMEIATAGATVARLGGAAAINTLGNIAGVLLFGFVVLPRLGGLDAALLIACCAAALGLILLVTSVAGQARRWVALLAVAAIGLLWQQRSATLDYHALSSGANVYFAAQDWGRVVDHAESIDGGLTAVAQGELQDRPVKTLLTNGKFQGNDWLSGEMQAQIGFAMAPLMHQERRERALVIGYGTGATSRVFHEAGFKRVDIAELSADIVRLADQHFPVINRQVSSQPGVRLNMTDGRNLLLLSPDRYDVVSIELTSIWFAGAASLYNHEFYELAKRRMAEDGVLQQWVQLHRLTPEDILTVVASLRSSFHFVSLYVLGGQGVLVATNDPNRALPRLDAVQAIESFPGLEEVRTVLGRPVRALIDDRLLAPDGVDRFVAGPGVDPAVWVSTDDNVRLEYSTPRANVRDARISQQQNLEILKRFSVKPEAPATPAAAASR